MSDDQFDKLYKYMQDGFAEVNRKLDEKASQDSLDRLTNSIDATASWARKVSEKTGIPLENL